MKSYFGLDCLQASSRPDGSGGSWPVRDPQGSPFGFWSVGGGHRGEPEAQDSEGGPFVGSSGVSEGSAVRVFGRRVPGTPGSASRQPGTSSSTGAQHLPAAPLARSAVSPVLYT